LAILKQQKKNNIDDCEPPKKRQKISIKQNILELKKVNHDNNTNDHNQNTNSDLEDNDANDNNDDDYDINDDNANNNNANNVPNVTLKTRSDLIKEIANSEKKYTEL